MAVEQQLSLEVGGEIGQFLTSSFTVRGRIPASGQLKRNQAAHVLVSDEDGEVVFAAYGDVKTVAFKTREKDGVQWTERAHGISLRVEAA